MRCKWMRATRSVTPDQLTVLVPFSGTVAGLAVNVTPAAGVRVGVDVGAGVGVDTCAAAVNVASVVVAGAGPRATTR
jgi:hypothetical protein